MKHGAKEGYRQAENFGVGAGGGCVAVNGAADGTNAVASDSNLKSVVMKTKVSKKSDSNKQAKDQEIGFFCHSYYNFIFRR